MPNLGKNLQLLAERSKSVSELCRQLDINRHQFARYLSGASKPSAFNLRKIGKYFGIPASELSLNPNKFAQLHGDDTGYFGVEKARLTAPMRGASLGDTEAMKAYTGYYYTYLQTPSYPKKLLQALAHLRSDGTNVYSSIVEQIGEMPDRTRHRSTYEGVVSNLNGCLFIIDMEMTNQDTILETILRLPYRRKKDVLFGMIMGMTTGNRRMPFASITAWKFLGKKIDRQSKLDRCGFYDVTAKNIDPAIRDAFAQQDVWSLYPKLFDRL